MLKHFYFGLVTQGDHFGPSGPFFLFMDQLYDFRVSVDLDSGAILVEDALGRSIPVDLADVKSFSRLLAHVHILYEEVQSIKLHASELSSKINDLETSPDKSFHSTEHNDNLRALAMFICPGLKTVK